MTALTFVRSETQTSESMMSIDDLVFFIEIKFEENLCASNQFPANENRCFEFDPCRPLFHPHAHEMFSVALPDNNILINAVLAMMRSIP